MMISAHIFLVPVIFLSTSRNFYFLFLATFLLIIINFFLQTDAFPPTQHQQLSTNNSAPSQHHQLSQVSTKSAQQVSTTKSAPPTQHQLTTNSAPSQHQVSTTKSTPPSQHHQVSTNNSAPTTQHQQLSTNNSAPTQTPTHTYSHTSYSLPQAPLIRIGVQEVAPLPEARSR